MYDKLNGYFVNSYTAEVNVHIRIRPLSKRKISFNKTSQLPYLCENLYSIMETNIMFYIQYKIKIIITDNKTYPNRNLIIITKGSTLYGLASLSNIVAYSKQ